MKRTELKKLIREEIHLLKELGISEKNVCTGSKICYGWGRAIAGSLKLKYDKVKYVLRNHIMTQSGASLYLSDGSFVGKENMIHRHLDWCIVK